MPNRIIKESICDSEDIDKLTWFEEVFFYRLLVNCDDYGRFDGRVSVLKNRLFTLKDNLTRKNIESALNKLARVGLVCLYEIDGKPFLFLPTWNKHQNVRAKKSKFPEPHESNCKQMNTNDFNCKQMKSNASKCSRNPIQSESNPIRERETRPPAREGQAVTAERKAYGEFCNVMLTEEERAALSEKYGDAAEALIDKFSAKLRSKGYRFADHYATIVLWASEDKRAEGAAAQKREDVEDWFERRIKQTFGEGDA